MEKVFEVELLCIVILLFIGSKIYEFDITINSKVVLVIHKVCHSSSASFFSLSISVGNNISEI